MFKFTEQKYKFMKAYCESLCDFSNDLVLRLLRRLKKGNDFEKMEQDLRNHVTFSRFLYFPASYSKVARYISLGKTVKVSNLICRK
jgi:hypothetical protein